MFYSFNKLLKIIQTTKMFLNHYKDVFQVTIKKFVRLSTFL